MGETHERVWIEKPGRMTIPAPAAATDDPATFESPEHRVRDSTVSQMIRRLAPEVQCAALMHRPYLRV